MLSNSPRLPALVAIVLASCVTGYTIRTATFIPWGTDPANYVITAKRWAAGDIFGPKPLQLWVPPLEAGVPLGSRAGPETGTDVSMYPLGFPVFLAAADLLNREFGIYLVPPISLGLLVWVTFSIARRLAGPRAGLIAAAMTAHADYARPRGDVDERRSRRTSKYQRLAWRSRAVFIAGTGLWYLDFADRDGSRDRARAPIDVLR